MDELAERLGWDQVDKEELAFHSAKSVTLGASAMMARWHRRAKESFGEENEITQHYAEILAKLKKQYESIWNWDQNKEKTWAEAKAYALELSKKYGGKKEKEILIQDHYARFQKANGPK